LKALPAFQKLEALRTTISAYRKPDTHSLPEPSTDKVSPSRSNGRTVSREGSKTSENVSVAIQFLRKHGRRATAREILEAVMPEKITHEGLKAINAFASSLSHNEFFDNVRGKGYGLKEWNGAGGAQHHSQTADHTSNDDSSAASSVVSVLDSRSR